ncbi:1-(5-phosphoribosyl)-5-[(5-phosphoribosylamino)methylideneamino]imidazole-4-carboxamide isomerase [Thermohalobacter berrensis]|uniref:1-(5-phosphoribosyl)-5-[(5-phosphoribosylamino)methylideneamino] imidazole-4-carboxamide isomerase n=1 Tax=Thermohalobacter berrensis TaxID=99594 RepID=A0A419T5S2_9FIRM|nr:1-(5-phosphoribosyl)-5-[(5-phosphoribosylamino)methylideneamino]imidazole-4-carboxamide isomerase [Thermohalobacter berrensis]RKD32927.1 1-(5-phosphoribosyl)-5-[(5-phosphoribosylamino)methylideneamino]imidazole-4-carboxamide isomerase [Thermohalobacter berrensis]
MIIFPAIDIKKGNCVRLKQGNFKDITVYSNSPSDIAKRWEVEGARYLHIVDLDGAVGGLNKNIKSIEEILKTVDIPIQVGGGIRNRASVERMLSLGVKRVILGSLAVRNKQLLKELVEDYGERIIVSIDAREGQVAVDGWKKVSSINSLDLIKELESMGLKTIVYTDILRDGMMKGPNFEIYKTLQEKTEVNIIASGGISSLDDVKRLKNMGVYGCIIGKALYTGKVSLKGLLEVAKC